MTAGRMDRLIDMSEPAARAHIERFNAAVTTGDWSAYLAGFHPDAVMTFDGPSVGPFVGREAIAEAYATQPPDDTIEIRSVRTEGATDVLRFAWSRGGTGRITIHRTDGLISELAVHFD
jgi:steroid delta-isomerase